MLGNYRVAAQLVASRVVLSSLGIYRVAAQLVASQVVLSSLGNYRVAAQLVASRVVLSSTELVSHGGLILLPRRTMWHTSIRMLVKSTRLHGATPLTTLINNMLRLLQCVLNIRYGQTKLMALLVISIGTNVK
jgi:hypothetical protein